MYELTLKLGKIRQGENSVTKYFNSLKHLWQDLNFNDYEWKSPKDSNHHQKTKEDNRIFRFLIGLNVEFDEVRGRIIGRKSSPSIRDVFLKFAMRRAVVLSCSIKKTPAILLKTLPLLSVLMLAEPTIKNLIKSPTFGVIIAINHTIRVKHAERFMVNQQMERVSMKTSSIVLSLHIRLNLFPLAKSKRITF